MFNPSEGAAAPTNPPANPSPANPPTIPPANGPAIASSECEPVRHMLFGTPYAVRSTIHLLYKRGYAEPNDWSQPISTGKPREVMTILTRRVRVSP
ncbi:MAG: hypothetical protein WBD47_12620 [Phormidesmis sp.]